MLNHQVDLDRTFQALADPTRRAMVARLTQGPASVSDLARPLSMSLPGAVQHLRVLEAAGLIVTAKEGRVRTCRVAPDALGAAERWLTDRRSEWEARLDRLEAYLAETADEGDKS